MYTRFWPKKRPRNAVSGITTTVAMTNPVVIQVISWMVAPTAPRTWGSATFTMDESMVPMSVPKLTEIVTSHLFVAVRVGAPARGKAAAAVLTAPSPPRS